jgi:glycosyltransferase involved in cell wall biosynthesis
MPLASIIIPTCNRTEDLRRCINTLFLQLPTEGSVDIIVCDDGSSDESRKMLASDFPSVKWSQGPRRGPGANRNHGGKTSNSEWLVFLDDDCVPREGFLAAYLSAFEAAGPKSLFHGLTFPYPKLTSLGYESPEVTGPNKIFASCNFAIRKSLFEVTGGFDERYLIAFEDIEYFARLDRLGADAQCVSGAAVDHPLRPIPPSGKIGKRWESRVISTLDLGAGPMQVATLLPKHALGVILSRFRGKKLTLENAKAAVVFGGEFLYMLAHLPGWIQKHAKGPRSRFWTEQVALGKAPPRFGL